MANKRISDKILIELRKKFPNKTDKELLELRRKILRKFKVSDILKKPTKECFRRAKKEFIRETTQKVFESLQLIKFTYNNYKHDKHPKVKVLDFKYKGQPHQKTYGKRDDLLGWNINAYSNKKYAKKAIDDIDSFSRMLGANSGKEKYKRIKYFFPQQAKLIRRYMRKHIVNLKHKPGVFLWKSTSFNDLIKFDKESY